MGGQIRWLWTATVGQFWTQTTLFGWRTTIAVRRLLVWLIPGAMMSWKLSLEQWDVFPGAVFAGFMIPWVTGFLVLLMTFAQALWRACSIPFTQFGGLLGLPGWALMKMLDGLWRIEAGPGPAAAQAAETSADRVEMQQMGLEQQLFSAMSYDGPVEGAFADSLDLRLDTPDGPKTGSRPRLSGGALLATFDGGEQKVGDVVSVGDGYEIRSIAGSTMTRFDRRGFGADGRLLVRLEGTDEQGWSDFMQRGRPERQKLKGGPLVHTVAAGVLIGLSVGFQGMIPVVSGWFADDDGSATATPSPEEANAPEAAEASRAARVENPAIGVAPAAEAGAELRRMVEHWASTQTDSDMAAYSATYAPDFVGIKRTNAGTTHPYPSLDAWLERKKAAFEGGHEVHARWIQASAVDGPAATVRFAQYWRNRKGYADKGIKQLGLRRTDAGWRITREEMLSSGLWEPGPPPPEGRFDLAQGSHDSEGFAWAFARDQLHAWCHQDGRCADAVTTALRPDGRCSGTLDVSAASAGFETGCGHSFAFARDGASWRVLEDGEAAPSRDPRATHRVFGVAQDKEPWLNMRTGKNGKIIGRLQEGEAVRLIAEHGKWLEVEVLEGQLAGQAGWIFGKFTRALR